MRKIIITIVIAIPVIVLAIGVYSFFTKRSAGTPAFDPSAAPSAVVPNIVTAMPADAPTGNRISIQGTNGAVSMKNFYNSAKGYWQEVDAVLLEQNPAYAIWYYRNSSSFGIVLTATGTTDDITAAEAALVADLGIDKRSLCTLSVLASYPVDGGAPDQAFPLPDCAAFTSGA